MLTSPGAMVIPVTRGNCGNSGSGGAGNCVTDNVAVPAAPVNGSRAVIVVLPGTMPVMTLKSCQSVDKSPVKLPFCRLACTPAAPVPMLKSAFATAGFDEDHKSGYGRSLKFLLLPSVNVTVAL